MYINNITYINNSIHLLHESLFGQHENVTQLKGSFWCHVIDTKGVMFY